MQALFVFFLRKKIKIYKIILIQEKEMSFKYNFLFKCFVVAIFSFCEVVNNVIADEIRPTAITGVSYTAETQRQISIENARIDERSRAGDGIVQTICPSGQYVYKCGRYRIGFNWLKSASFPDSNTSLVTTIGETTIPLRNRYKSTKNYYVGTTSELFKQMQIFFNGSEGESILAKGDENDEILTISYTDYTKDRETILNYLCHPSNTTVTCAACPNNADVPESSVELNGENLTISGTWNFHTFADCYMQEFEDSTGSYHYIDPSTEDGKAKCYYTNTNPETLSVLNGDAIGTFIPGLYIYNSIEDAEIAPITIKSR